MLRTGICLAAMLLVAGTLNHTASAQTAAPTAKPAKMKLNEMKAKWRANKPKYAACRKEVKTKGLAGDERWFFIEECMGKS